MGFGFEAARDGAFWILHDGSKIALVMRDCHEVRIDLREFSAPPSGKDYYQPAALHNPSIQGSRLSTMWDVQSVPGWKTTFAPAVASEDSASYITETLDGSGNVLGRERVAVSVDPDSRRYTVDVDAELTLPGDARETVEFCNFMAAGADDPRPTTRRFPVTLVQSTDGSFIKMPRHHVPTAGLRRRDLKQDGIISFCGEDWNPVVRLIPAGSVYSADQCHALHDIHILALPAGRKSGSTVYKGRLRMFVDGAEDWPERIASARPAEITESEVKHSLEDVPCLAAGELCDFERGTDISTEDFRFGWLSICTGDGASMRWDRTVGYSGSSSLLLECGDPASCAAAQVNPIYWAVPGEPAYAACKVKVDSGRARVCISMTDWVDFKCHTLSQAEKTIDGPSDWREVVVGPIVAPEGSDFVDLQLSIFGRGKAWFDDVLFVPAPVYQ